MEGGGFAWNYAIFRFQYSSEELCCCCFCRYCFCSGTAPRAQLIKKSTWLLHLTGNKSPHTRRDRNGVACAWSCRSHPHTGTSEHSWRLSHSLSLLVEVSTQDETVDGILSVPQGTLFPYYLRSIGLMAVRDRPTPTRFLIYVHYGHQAFAFFTKCVTPVGQRNCASGLTELTLTLGRSLANISRKCGLLCINVKQDI